MIAKGIMDLSLRRPFYIAVDNFSMVDVYLGKHQKVSEVANAPVELVHIREERY